MKRILLVMLFVFISINVFGELTWKFPFIEGSQEGVYITKIYPCIGNFDGQKNYIWLRTSDGSVFVYLCASDTGDLSPNDSIMYSSLLSAFNNGKKINLCYETDNSSIKYIVLCQP